MSGSFIIEAAAKLQFLAGADWQPIDSIEKEDIAELLDRRKENKQPKAGYSSVCHTQHGTYAIGLVGKVEGRIKRGKCYSLAVICSNFAQVKRVNDALFVFAANGKWVLIGIKNGLPIFDASFTDSGEFEGRIRDLLSIFDSGCTIYGDESLLPPPVAALSLSDLAANPRLFETGKMEPIGSIAPMLGLVTALSIVCIVGFNWYSAQQARDAAMKAAIEEAKRNKPAAIEETPAQKLEKKRKAYVLSRGDCTKKGALEGYKAATAILEDYGGFLVNVVTVNCTQGAAAATMAAKGADPDLFVYKKDPRLTIDASMTSALLKHEFDADKVADIDVSKLPSWLEFLAKHGTELRSYGDVGIKFGFSAPTPIFTREDAAEIPVLSGGMTITGNAIYLLPMLNRIDGVYWKSFSIIRSNDADGISQQHLNKGEFQFRLEGDFYVTQ